MSSDLTGRARLAVGLKRATGLPKGKWVVEILVGKRSKHLTLHTVQVESRATNGEWNESFVLPVIDPWNHVVEFQVHRTIFFGFFKKEMYTTFVRTDLNALIHGMTTPLELKRGARTLSVTLQAMAFGVDPGQSRAFHAKKGRHEAEIKALEQREWDKFMALHQETSQSIQEYVTSRNTIELDHDKGVMVIYAEQTQAWKDLKLEVAHMDRMFILDVKEDEERCSIVEATNDAFMGIWSLYLSDVSRLKGMEQGRVELAKVEHEAREEILVHEAKSCKDLQEWLTLVEKFHEDSQSQRSGLEATQNEDRQLILDEWSEMVKAFHLEHARLYVALNYESEKALFVGEENVEFRALVQAFGHEKGPLMLVEGSLQARDQISTEETGEFQDLQRLLEQFQALIATHSQGQAALQLEEQEARTALKGEEEANYTEMSIAFQGLQGLRSREERDHECLLQEEDEEWKTLIDHMQATIAGQNGKEAARDAVRAEESSGRTAILDVWWVKWMALVTKFKTLEATFQEKQIRARILHHYRQMYKQMERAEKEGQAQTLFAIQETKARKEILSEESTLEPQTVHKTSLKELESMYQKALDFHTNESRDRNSLEEQERAAFKDLQALYDSVTLDVRRQWALNKFFSQQRWAVESAEEQLWAKMKQEEGEEFEAIIQALIDEQTEMFRTAIEEVEAHQCMLRRSIEESEDTKRRSIHNRRDNQRPDHVLLKCVMKGDVNPERFGGNTTVVKIPYNADFECFKKHVEGAFQRSLHLYLYTDGFKNQKKRPRSALSLAVPKTPQLATLATRPNTAIGSPLNGARTIRNGGPSPRDSVDEAVKEAMVKVDADTYTTILQDVAVPVIRDPAPCLQMLGVVPVYPGIADLAHPKSMKRDIPTGLSSSSMSSSAYQPATFKKTVKLTGSVTAQTLPWSKIEKIHDSLYKKPLQPLAPITNQETEKVIDAETEYKNAEESFRQAEANFMRSWELAAGILGESDSESGCDTESETESGSQLSGR